MAGETVKTTSRILNRMQYDAANTAAATITAAQRPQVWTQHIGTCCRP